MLLLDVPFIPRLFLQYQQETVAAKSAFIKSGILVTNNEIQSRFEMGGKTIDLPFFGDLSGDSEVLDDETALTPASLSGDLQTGVRMMRGRAWKDSDLAAELSGSDPQRAIAVRTGEYWIREYQRLLIIGAEALFKTSGALLASHDSGGLHTENNGDAIVDGIAVLGDAGSSLTGIAMHSKQFYDLAKKDIFDKTTNQALPGIPRASGQMLEMASYLGRPVFVDDSLPFLATGGGPGTDTDRPVATMYLFGAGAFAYANAPAKVPVETDRNKLKGVNYLINRTHFMIHPNGIKWKGNPVKASPSDVEFGTATNWEKAYNDDKNIRFVRVRTYL
jgi:hypothetical protein